ncbi:MAG: hypothetical protein ACRC1K_11225 [Planctomycetia bacterium]
MNLKTLVPWMIPCTVVFGGCSNPRTVDFSLPVAYEITVYEGLPHHFYDERLLESEKKSKPTIEINGSLFYRQTHSLTADDAKSLRALFSDSETYETIEPTRARASKVSRIVFRK